MQSVDLFQQINIVTVKTTPKTSIFIGKIPEGNYTYKFLINNNRGKPGKITVYVGCQNVTSEKQSISFTKEIVSCDYQFSSIVAYERHYIFFQVETGDEILLTLPVSPIRIQNTKTLPAFLFGLDKRILARVNELEPADATHSFNTNDPSGQSNNSSKETRPVDMKEIEAFINARYFRGLISLEQSQRQLDYVVYNKTLQPDGTKGFNKLKRKFYRKILVFVYRIMTKNQSRKLYFAKLYRNYVNSSLLNDNLHNQQ